MEENTHWFHKPIICFLFIYNVHIYIYIYIYIYNVKMQQSQFTQGENTVVPISSFNSHNAGNAFLLKIKIHSG